MTSLYIYHLQFEGPVRFGASGIGMEETELTLPSDGLTSAFLNALAVRDGPEAVCEYIEESLAGNPPLVFSSLFPYGSDPSDPCNIVEAVPRPLCLPNTEEAALREMGKELKKLRWLRPADAALWLDAGEATADDLNSWVSMSSGLARGTTDHNSAAPWYGEELRPRVALDRDTAGSQIWLCAAIRFVRGAGLYGLARVREDWTTRWLPTLRLLGQLGVGGERTYGFGLFEVDDPRPLGAAWKRLVESTSSRRLLLSAYYPAESERPTLAEALESWDLRESRGYIVSGRYSTALKRKRVRFLVEGSVLRAPLMGALADVTPDNHTALGLSHRVYRCGLAFTLR